MKKFLAILGIAILMGWQVAHAGPWTTVASPPATETVAGTSERCTDAEMTTGTTRDCDVTPANAKVELDKKATANPLATDTLWDAVGDLVVGTGPNTAGRLAGGTTGQILTGVTGAQPAWSGTPSGLTSLGVTTLTATKELSLAPATLTLDTNGDAAVTQKYHYIDTFAAAISDTVRNLTGGAAGQTLYIRAAHTDRTIILDDSTGNYLIPMGTVITLADTASWVYLIYDGDLAKWVVIGTLPDTLALSALNMTSGTSSIPWVVNNTAAPTVEGQAIWDADGNFLTVGDGAATVYVHPTASSTAGNLGALNLVTTGTIQGGIIINSDANGMSQGEMTTVGMYGTMFFATGAATWNIPDALAGMSFCVYSTGANAIILNPDDNDDITLDGTLLANGDSITSAATAGAFICLIAESNTHWFTLGRNLVWTDTN